MPDYYFDRTITTTDNTSNVVWVQPQPHNGSCGFSSYRYRRYYDDPLMAQAAAESTNRELDQLLLEEREKEEKPMRGLYRVYIVDPKTDVVLTTPAFVAKDENSARMKALQRNADKLTHDIDHYDVITERVGNVQPKKETQTVRIVKGED